VSIRRRRSSARIQVGWSATALIGVQRIPCEIVNISRNGAKLRMYAGGVVSNDMILLCEKFGSLEGQVVWREGGLMGVRFTEPSAAAVLQPCLASLYARAKFGRRHSSS
jgi:hypothetical protein